MDLKAVLSDLLAFSMVYLPKYLCEFTQLFQNIISVFLKVTNYWIVTAAQVGYFQKNRDITLKQLYKITKIFE